MNIWLGSLGYYRLLPPEIHRMTNSCDFAQVDMLKRFLKILS